TTKLAIAPSCLERRLCGEITLMLLFSTTNRPSTELSKTTDTTKAATNKSLRSAVIMTNNESKLRYLTCLGSDKVREKKNGWRE
ncbi:hypothetical protein U1Q18_009990, partial [Sarracenia purpurea var. burkii]